MYALYYWPGLPGRGEFVRLVLEQAGMDYQDVGIEQGIEPIVALRQTTGGFAPPYLQDEDQVLAQVPAICMYLGRKHELVPEKAFAQAKVHQLFLTVMDVVNEVHDTHHPISVALAYEDQKEAAVERAANFLNGRLENWMQFFSKVINSNEFLDPVGVSIADLALFQLFSGLHYAFPKACKKSIDDVLVSHYQRVAELPNIAAYLKSNRRQSFNETGIFRHYPELDLQD